MSVLVEVLSCQKGSEVSVGEHGALWGASGARCVREGEAIVRLHLELLLSVIKQQIPSPRPYLAKRNQLNPSFLENSSVLGRDWVEADQSAYSHHVLTLQQRFNGRVVHKASSDESVSENVSDILVS